MRVLYKKICDNICVEVSKVKVDAGTLKFYDLKGNKVYEKYFGSDEAKNLQRQILATGYLDLSRN